MEITRQAFAMERVRFDLSTKHVNAQFVSRPSPVRPASNRANPSLAQVGANDTYKKVVWNEKHRASRISYGGMTSCNESCNLYNQRGRWVSGHCRDPSTTWRNSNRLIPRSAATHHTDLRPWHYERPVRRNYSSAPVIRSALLARETTKSSSIFSAQHSCHGEPISRHNRAPEVPVSISNEDSPPQPTNCIDKRSIKRSLSPSVNTVIKRARPSYQRLDLLVSACLEMGPMHDFTTGCSCPKSKCIALYCDCFKAGRRCDPDTCACFDCKNTVSESGPNGARSHAIRTILARNPRAFITAGLSNNHQKLPPGEYACNCVRSRCLKLYCKCFQNGKTCNPNVCVCVKCLNTTDDESGERQAAVQQTLEKRPDAFQGRPKDKDAGCACKNNRCIRKYCECYRKEVACSEMCKCNNCENQVNGNKVDAVSFEV